MALVYGILLALCSVLFCSMRLFLLLFFVVFVVCFLSCTTRIRYVDYAAVSDETSVEATE